MLRQVRLILEMIRFSHTLFALPFALMAALMAWNYDSAMAAQVPEQNGRVIPSAVDRYAKNALGIENSGLVGEIVLDPGPYSPSRWLQALAILLCMVFARSAAMAFNRLVDRRIDAENPRTAMRHLPAGTLSVAAVTAFAVACGLLFIASTALFLPNRLPLYLSAPVLAFVCGYSFAKRFTALAHLWLGVALSLAPIAVWIALRGTVEWPPVVLAGAVALWVMGFDIIYACQDFDFDQRRGLHSVPARLGIKGSLRVAALCHAAMIGLLALLPLVYPAFGAAYWVGLAATTVLLVYEHWLVRPDDLSRVNTAFFHVNAVIGLGLLAVTILDLLIVPRLIT
ncbi:MAG: UbiA family prenyltransferase [Planctomycetes bacterium]|nr:UbiA family prenyltransferase [Planctomycetota bacterium]